MVVKNWFMWIAVLSLMVVGAFYLKDFIESGHQDGSSISAPQYVTTGTEGDKSRDLGEPKLLENTSLRQKGETLYQNMKSEDSLDAASEAIKIQNSLDSKDREKEDMDRYYQSLVRHYSININDDVDIENSIFKKRSFVLPKEFLVVEGQDEIVHKHVFKFPLSDEDLIKTLSSKSADNKSKKIGISLELPMYDFNGILRLITAQNCIGGSEALAYCSVDGHRLTILRDFKGVKMILSDNPNARHRVPYTEYFVEGSSILFYNYLGEYFNMIPFKEDALEGLY